MLYFVDKITQWIWTEQKRYRICQNGLGSSVLTVLSSVAWSPICSETCRLSDLQRELFHVAFAELSESNSFPMTLSSFPEYSSFQYKETNANLYHTALSDFQLSGRSCKAVLYFQTLMPLYSIHRHSECISYDVHCCQGARILYFSRFMVPFGAVNLLLLFQLPFVLIILNAVQVL
jgi:hypothetical protein